MRHEPTKARWVICGGVSASGVIEKETGSVPAVPDTVLCLALLGLSNALVWPSVWPLALEGLGPYTAAGSALLIMGIAGQIWIVRQATGTKLVCRVPIYGSLKFLDRSGAETDTGLNVGDIVDIRGFIEGGSKGAAIFKFRMPRHQPQTVRFESRFEAQIGRAHV